MYDTRWPRPGPAMAAVAALLGLVAGIVLGLSSPGRPLPAQAAAPVETTVALTTTTLPDDFHTVVLGSFNDLANADDTMQRLREAGVDDAAVLKQSDYPSLGTAYAVYSGRFKTEAEAEAHEVELEQLGITDSYPKHVTR